MRCNPTNENQAQGFQIKPSGYSHPLYASSLDEYGIPLELKKSGGWLLARSIPEGILNDAMGCYPIFSCLDWTQLPADIEDVSEYLVSITLVSDPFGAYDQQLLLSCFDQVKPFKEHYVTDLEKPFVDFTSASHIKFARGALRKVDIEICTDPITHLDDWCLFYEELVSHKNISGIREFSRNIFKQQLAIPGCVLFRASAGGETLALDWWFVQGDVAQGHLVAMNMRGYKLHASYALKLAILEYFKGRVRWLNLGGTPGPNNQGADGLAAFKQGWTSEVRTAWLCGRICNKQAYSALVKQQQITNPEYFPLYRQGEFT